MTDFLPEAQQLVAAWRSSAEGNPQADLIAARLGFAAHLVSAAHFGASLITDPIQHQPVAAAVLVFGCGQTTIDLCATCLLRWHGKPPRPGKEWDFAQLSTGVGNLPLTPAQRAWYDNVALSPDAAELLDFRHAVIHRILRIDARVTPGVSSSMLFSPSTDAVGTERAEDQLPRIAAFVEATWREFILALA